MNFLKSLAPKSHWLLRFALAAVFLYHGLGKFPVADMLAKGMGMPVLMIYLLAIMEVTGGLLILWGGFGPDWATRIAGAIFSVVMLGAIMMVHINIGWNFAEVMVNVDMFKMALQQAGEGAKMVRMTAMGGMEFQVTLLMLGLFFLIQGNNLQKSNDA